MVAYVKHRKMLKSKQSKPKTGSDVPLSPSQPSVCFSQPIPDFDIEARIASLSTELSASLAHQVDGLGSSLQQSFLALSSDLSTQLAARISALSSTSCTVLSRLRFPLLSGQVRLCLLTLLYRLLACSRSLRHSVRLTGTQRCSLFLPLSYVRIVIGW